MKFVSAHFRFQGILFVTFESSALKKKHEKQNFSMPIMTKIIVYQQPLSNIQFRFKDNTGLNENKMF